VISVVRREKGKKLIHQDSLPVYLFLGIQLLSTLTNTAWLQGD